ELDAFEAASGGQIGLDSSAIAAAGTPTVLVRTDGSTSPVVVNGRGLMCTPACDNVTPISPNATDHFVVMSVLSAGARAMGDAFVVSALQNAVNLDSRVVVVVAQASTMDVSVVNNKTTIQEAAPS